MSIGNRSMAIAERKEKAAVQSVTAAEILERTKKLFPTLRERAARAEELRRVPEETIRDFHDAGLFKMLQPKRYGGHELDVWSFYQAVIEAGKGCSASAWVLSLLGIHSWMIPLYGQQACEDVWGDNPESLVSSGVAPVGKVERVSGGFRLSGRWAFSSGCDHANWVILGGIDHSRGEPDGVRMQFLLPRSDYRIDDTWFVSGLRGSGSKDIVVEGAFVPEHRSHCLLDLVFGKCRQRDGFPESLFAYPWLGVFVYGVGVPSLGVAFGALDVYQEQTRTRVRSYTGLKAVEQAPAQIRLAEAASEIDAAHLIVKRDFEQMHALSEAGNFPSFSDLMRYRWNASYVAKLCRQSVDRLYTASGGRALFESHPLQRAFRDIHAMSAHTALDTDITGQVYGRDLLGLPPRLDL